VQQINRLTGKAGAGVSDAVTRTTLLENLCYAAERLANADLRLSLEPVNSRDVPGFWLDSADKALLAVDAIIALNLFPQFDIYHAQRSGG
jgi:hydroxypyruvate isomerase